MILTEDEINRGVATGDIVITPFDPQCIEPNSYGFHLGENLLVYREEIVDSYFSSTQMSGREVNEITIPVEGYVLQPKKFYLGCTWEKMGSRAHACELYARLSTSLRGIFIQTSAPLGHTGAIIRWTLEILVIHPVRVYPRMQIGKICFWENFGKIVPYNGRYRNSISVMQSMLSRENP